MKKATTNKKEVLSAGDEQLITRKQAIKKTGYMALSAATMMILLNNSANSQVPVSTAPSAPTKTSTSKPDGVWND